MSKSPMSQPELPFGEPERWLPVVGWERLYEVSSLGRVRSLTRKTRNGTVRGGRILKAQPGPLGYLHVVLSDRPRLSNRAVHLLVLDAFHGPRPAGMVGCHGPGGNQDNRASVLCWDTQAANTGRDRDRDGTMPRGMNHARSVLTDEQVADMRRRCADGESQRSVALSYGLASVHEIVTGRIWTHLPGAVSLEGPRRGNGHYLSKLTDEKVRVIRARHGDGERQVDLMREFGISASTMSQVVARKTWKHVA